jgi:hypothetical protein
MDKKSIFNNFSEYWHYARSLSENQRKIIFRNLSVKQKAELDNSYRHDGWNDVFYRNDIDKKIDNFELIYGYNVIDIRLKALHGKSVYLPTKFWKEVEHQMGQYQPESVEFAIGGLKCIECNVNPEVCLIIYNDSDNI